MKITLCLIAFLFTGTCSIAKDGTVTFPDIVCDKPYSVQLSTAYTYDGFPPGLTYDSNTGVLSGTVACKDLAVPAPTASNPDPYVNWDKITFKPKVK